MENSRFVVATDWSEPSHVASALRSFLVLVRNLPISLIIAVPHTPGRSDEVNLQRILGELPFPASGEIRVESFSEVLQQPYEAAVVPQGDPQKLLIQLGDWITALAVAGHSRVGGNSAIREQLRQRLSRFEERQVVAPPVTQPCPTWHGTYVGNGRILAELRSGGRAYLPANNRATTPNVLQSGIFEPELQAYIANNVPIGGTVVDVGANIGLITIALARAVRSPGRVIAFEPVRQNLEFLRHNIETNWLMNIVEVHEVAASNADGTATMLVSDDWNSLGSLTQDEIHLTAGYPATNQRSEDVTTARLDTTLAHLDRIDLVKIDVEGAEDFVFDGMTDLFTRGAVDRIVFECMKQHLGPSWRSLMDRLQSFEREGWIFGIPTQTGAVRQLPAAALAASDEFRNVTMERAGIRHRVEAVRL